MSETSQPRRSLRSIGAVLAGLAAIAVAAILLPCAWIGARLRRS